MPVRDILQLGNPTLRVNCDPVRTFDTEELQSLLVDMRETLNDFRARNGFGRGIAAPQIGVTQRVVFIQVEEPIALVNPTITKRSRKQIVLWDDCFSFPNLLVKVRRHLKIEVRYHDEHGKRHSLKAEGAMSELLQHEIDHINGILAIDRAIDSKHIVFRSEFEKWKASGKEIIL
ncbi:MAG: peptide deformylase [Ignavibacteriae bacterium]|nr:peptide deformylase [Ignavibacteriota bacterium]